MFFQAHGVIAITVKTFSVEAAEVTNARKRDVNEAVNKFKHAIAAKGNLCANNHAVAKLKAAFLSTELQNMAI